MYINRSMVREFLKGSKIAIVAIWVIISHVITDNHKRRVEEGKKRIEGDPDKAWKIDSRNTFPDAMEEDDQKGRRRTYHVYR